MLNILLKEVIEGHPVSEQRLKEVLGHTPVQVPYFLSLYEASALQS